MDEDASDTLVDLFAAFGDLEDADGDLTLLVTGNTNPALFSTLLIDPVTGMLTLDYAANANGTSTLTVQATDSGGLSVSQTFDVNVAAINDDPNADGSTLNTNEDTTVEIDLRTLVDDLETPDDDLAFSVLAMPSTAVWNCSPTATQHASHPLTITTDPPPSITTSPTPVTTVIPRSPAVRSRSTWPSLRSTTIQSQTRPRSTPTKTLRSKLTCGRWSTISKRPTPI